MLTLILTLLCVWMETWVLGDHRGAPELTAPGAALPRAPACHRDCGSPGGFSHSGWVWL